MTKTLIDDLFLMDADRYMDDYEKRPMGREFLLVGARTYIDFVHSQGRVNADKQLNRLINLYRVSSNL